MISDLHKYTFVYALNWMLVIADLVVTARPVRLLHLLHPIVLGINYTLVSFLVMVYYCPGGPKPEDHYSFLAWNKYVVSKISQKFSPRNMMKL
jgi:hypothetical protein